MRKILVLFLFVINSVFIAKAQWETVHPKPSPDIGNNFQTISFKNYKTGLIGGYNQYVEGKILKTIDAGATFDTINLNSGMVTKIIRYDGKTYAVANNQILISNDEFTTFTVLADTLMFNDIFFINDSIVYGCGYSSFSYVYKSTNGGQDWEVISTFTNAYLKQIVFSNDSTGILIDHNGTLYKTTDFGNTWNSFTFPCWYISKYSILNDSIGYIIGRALGATDSAHLYKTTNFGNSWDKISELYVDGLPSDIEFKNENVGYIIFNIPHLLKTTDGGTTWTYQSSSYPSNGNFGHDLMDMQLLNGDTAVLVGFGQFYRTTNGGDYFQKMEDNNSTHEFSIYPNPTKDYLNLEVDNISNIQISNSIGQILLNRIIQKGKNRINLSSLQNGVYYVIFSDEKSQLSKKLIIQH